MVWVAASDGASARPSSESWSLHCIQRQLVGEAVREAVGQPDEKLVVEVAEEVAEQAEFVVVEETE